MAQGIGYPQAGALLSGTNESAAPLPVGYNKLPEFAGVGAAAVPVMATTGPGGGNRLSVGSRTIDVSVDHRPCVLIGGDHPYNQLWGRNGDDGLAALYRSFGITPYIALNTRSLTGEMVGSNYFLGWDKVKALHDKGMVDLVAHGARHYTDWEAPDAGIHVKYTGTAATAKMYVTSTHVIGATAGAVADFTLAFADYPEIDQLVAAISAQPGWSCMRSPELLGSEKSGCLLTISEPNAKDCKSIPDTYGRRFSMAGGLRVFFDMTSGEAAGRCQIFLQTSTLTIYVDGRQLVSLTLASHTLGSLLTAIRAASPAFNLAARNQTTLVADGSQPYCTGEEDATNLTRSMTSAANTHYDCKTRPAVLTAGGLSPAYLRQRNIDACVEDCAAQGVAIREFAQSGDYCYDDILATNRVGTVDHYRGDPRFNRRAPRPIPTHRAVGFHTHQNLGGNYNSTEAIDALVDGIIASRGFTVDFLIHHVKTDATPNDGTVAGSSGFYLDSANFGAGDITEGPFVYLLTRLRAAENAGLLRMVRMSEVNRAAATAMPPQNLLFNGSLVMRSGAAMATDTTGRTITGWWSDLFSASSCAPAPRGGIRLAPPNGTKDYLKQIVTLERGGRYRAGCKLEVVSGTLTQAALRLYSPWGVMPDSMVGNQLGFIESTMLAQPYCDLAFDFEVAWPRSNGGAIVVGANTGPFDLSVNKNIRLTIENSTPAEMTIDCSALAANPAATTAKEVANAINAAVAASTQFASRQEFHNLARAENNRVVLELQREQDRPNQAGALIYSPGATASASTLIFGAARGTAFAQHGGESDGSRYPFELALRMTAANSLVVDIRDMYVVPLESGI